MINLLSFDVHGHYEDMDEYDLESILEHLPITVEWVWVNDAAQVYFFYRNRLCCAYLEDGGDFTDYYVTSEHEIKSIPYRYRRQQLLPRNYKGI